MTGGEVCDDGNGTNGDGCDDGAGGNCTVSACGNGVIAGLEACDDGNGTNGDGCDNNCTATACGNGVVTGGEVCDDGNGTDGDGCESNCTITSTDESSVTLSGGNLLLDDINGGTSNDTWAISYNTGTGYYTITALTGTIDCPACVSGDGTGSVQTNGALVTGGITVNGLGGDDVLTVDFSSGNPIPTGGITYDGGTGTTDVLNLTGGMTTSVTHNFLNANDGSVTLAGAMTGTINYTGLEPITDNLNAVDRAFDYSATAETITLANDTDANDGQSRISSNIGGEQVDFTHPTATLTINAGNTGDDIININGFDGNGFTAALTVGGGTGADAITLAAALNLGSGGTTGNLILTAETINLNNAGIDLTGGITDGDATFVGAVTLGTAVTVLANNIDFNGTVNNNGNLLTVTHTGIASQAQGNISGAGGLTKNGTGTFSLNAVNAYTGATTINAGKLLVTGSTVAASAMNVNNTTTLGGDGTVNGIVTAVSGATVAPGLSPGILNTGNIALVGGSTLTIEVDGVTPGSGHDQLNVTGTVDLGGATLNIVMGFLPVVGNCQ